MLRSRVREPACISHGTMMAATSDNVISCVTHYRYVGDLVTHCRCDRVSPCLCAKFSAIALNPVSFTASTTVCQVRGRVPVPAWLEVHLPSRSSIQSSGLPRRLVSMLSMVW